MYVYNTIAMLSMSFDQLRQLDVVFLLVNSSCLGQKPRRHEGFVSPNTIRWKRIIHKAAKIHKFIQQQRIYTHLVQPTHGNGGGADQYTQAENTNSGPGQNVHFQTVASLATSALY